MTLQTPLHMMFGGEPVVGVVPAQLIVHGDLTQLQKGFVQARFNQFCTTTRLSIAPSMTLNYILPDGSRMRATSIFGVRSVQVWPIGVEEAADPSTFFCIPFDETYLATQIKDTYRLKRWPDVDDTEPEELLDKLDRLRNCTFMPSARVSHPGNQTWFAHIEGETKHEFANMVLSWWGHPNRYNYSPLDAFLMRTPPSAESVFIAGGKLLYPAGLENDKAIYPRAWEDAMAGKFYQLGESSSMDEVEGINPPYATTAGLNAIWFNGVQFGTDFEVKSACIGKRANNDDESSNVVRVFSAPRGNGNIAKKIQILEFPLGMVKPPSGGILRKSRAVVFNLDIPFPSIPDCENYFSHYWCHPFYWNADGSEAMAILQFTCEFNAPPEFGTGIPVSYSVFGTSLLRLSKTNLGFDLSLMEFSGVTESLSKSSYPIIIDGSQFTGHTFSYHGTQTYPLAADYIGNSAKIIRGHVSETVSDNDGPYSANSSATVQSWVSLNGVEIDGLVNTGLKSASRGSDGDLNGASKFGSGGSSVSQSGKASRWAISGGDLRAGKIVLRDSPWYLTECPVNLNASMWINSSISTSVMWTHSSGYSETTFTGDDGYDYIKSYTYAYTYNLSMGSSSSFSNVGGRFVVLDTNSLEKNHSSEFTHPIEFKGLGSISISGSANASWEYKWEVDHETGVVTEGWHGDTPYGGVTDPFGSWPSPPNYMQTSTGLGEDSIVGEFPVTADSSLNSPGDPNFSNRVSLRRHRDGMEIRARNASYTGAGGYADVVFSSGAVSPDGKIQYIGLLSVALAAPNTKTPLPLFKLDKWYANGTEFVPDKDYPNTGAYKMLSSPVFVGPLP